ncbi:MAG: UV DNA damage repair endonuclease UvsE [Syntrophomonas sp.]|nr:UV DNA damage repair endonuclease UvsE [Syntrophomonas sp.]
MRIRFGYVAMSMVLEDCSPSKTVKPTNLSKIESETARQNKLTSLAKTNINNTRRLLFHNQAHGIKVFRVTSKLIPLATHPITGNWDWQAAVAPELALLGRYVRENGLRFSAHPDHFTLLNSPREEILAASIRDLEYHHQIFEHMGLGPSAKLVIHIGGSYADKSESSRRFLRNFENLPRHLKNRIILENDDKIYTVKDVLGLCEYAGIPMVLDIHHHFCNNNEDNIENYLPAIFDTWHNQDMAPKIHLSSPKDEKSIRYHADYIDAEFFIDFLGKAKSTGKDFDVMIEAKKKDLALFKLMDDLKNIPGIGFAGEATIEI